MKGLPRILAHLASSVLAVGAFAQTNPAPAQPPADTFPTISTDRPSFSDASSLVPLGHPQIEIGGTYFKVGGTKFGQGPELLFRYALSDRFELRLVNVNYSVFEGGGDGGFQDPGVGFKLRLLKPTRATGQPEVTFVGLLQVPLGGGAERAQGVQPTGKIAAYLPLSATDGIGGNLVVSYFTPDDAHFTQYAASLYEAHTFNAKLASFVEVYGLTPLSHDGHRAAFADAGFTYLLNKRTQVDLRYGTGFDQGRDGQYVGAGFAYRF